MTAATAYGQDDTKSDTITLLGSTASPYSRMVRIALIEKGLRHEWVEVASPALRHEKGKWMTVWTPNDAWNVEAFNPLGKIPVLLHQGRAWYDSRVICAYVDCLSPAPSLYGSMRQLGARAERVLFILRVEACCQGVCDVIAFAKGVYFRDSGTRSASLEVKTRTRIQATLREIERLYNVAVEHRVVGLITMADIALCVVLDYIDFRMPAIGWRDQFTTLNTRYAHMASREAFASTRLDIQRV